MTLTRQNLDPQYAPLIASSVEELLSLQDDAFVRCAYATVLGRDSDTEGLRHYLARIRSGESRRAILAAIRLSPEGRQRDTVLPGLDHAIRHYRWRYWPLLGSLLRLSGAGKERVDIRRQIAGIEAQFHRLSNLVYSSRVTAQSTVQHVHADKLQIDKSTPSNLSLDSPENLAELPTKQPVRVVASHLDESTTSLFTWPRVGWITTWNVKCGIATHVEHLVAALPPDEFVVFAARQEPRVRPDEPNCLRSWNLSKDTNGLEEIARELKPRSIGALVIQFNYGFFNHFELNDFIQSLIAQGIVIIVDLHSTVDPYGDVENFRLADFLGALRKCHLILAHSSLDLDRLKALGLIKNVTLFPHGVVNKGHGLTPPRKQGIPPVIASFGFCLPNKGLLELVEAVSLLKKESTPVRLLMVNAEHPAAESAAEVQKIKRAIEQLGLRDEVEMHTEFLDDNECLALLGKADLVVNPYQRTGESASGSARYGLTAGRPVAVTPLAIFDDLDDAVFHLPGIAPHEIAVGVASVLKHLKEGTETATRVKVAARQWIEEHDYSRQAIGLMRTARSLARSKKVARGAFINTAKENCSIHESGRMVFNCIRESDQYALDYFPLDTFDVSILAREGRIELLDKSKSSGAKPFDEYDFWVFNWHFITMAPLLALESIAQLAGAKFSIILELEPGDPLKLIPSDIFDGYIALDPTTPEAGKIFPFPRPLEGDPRIPHSSRAVPVIGSFGFGTPGKGFELLVEAVNREFDKAVVRINIPKGAYTSSMDSIHRQEYSKYIAMQCMRIAKPGIEVRVTSIFMSPHELVDWCADNDLNCFLYTRRQSGLSATTDQAIMSGRPLLTGSNDTFRHIHRYIPAYPIVSLREAIKTTAPMVRRMQKEWSQASFSETFERMLAKFGLISRYGNVGRELPTSGDQRKIIVVASRRSTSDDDILSYSTRLADCLGRSGNYEVIRMCCSDPSDLIAQTTKLRPSAVILADSFSVPRSVLTKALVHVPGANIILSDDPKFASADNVRSAGEPFVLARYPIIPYYTPYIASQEEPPRIMLIGFGCQASNLDEVMAKISQEVPGADVFLETPESNLSEFEIRASQVPKRLGHPIRLKHVLVSLPAKGDEIIRSFVENRLTVFFNDLNRTEELENLCSLALTTERPVAFTRAAPFRHFLNDGTFIEDQSISDIINLGIGAQIRLCHEFGEGNFYAQIDRLLTDELA